MLILRRGRGWKRSRRSHMDLRSLIPVGTATSPVATSHHSCRSIAQAQKALRGGAQRLPGERGAKEAPAVAQARAWLDKSAIPVWSGQISNRAGFVLSLSAGASAGEGNMKSLAFIELTRLWGAVEKSVEAINSARAVAGSLHGLAA